jgi:hypothetical protein
LTALDLHFLVPGDLDTRTGGYGYDRAIISGLRARGWTVHVVSVPGPYPSPSDADRALAGRALAALPNDALVLADGLAYGALPVEAERQRAVYARGARASSLGLETGIDALTSLRLLDRAPGADQCARRRCHRTNMREVEALGAARSYRGRRACTRWARLRVEGGRSCRCSARSIVPRATVRSTHWSGHRAGYLTCVGRSIAIHVCRRYRPSKRRGPLSGRSHPRRRTTGEALDAAYDTADLFVLPALRRLRDGSGRSMSGPSGRARRRGDRGTVGSDAGVDAGRRCDGPRRD